jgi:hypothetical protein
MKYGIFVIYENGQIFRYAIDLTFVSSEEAYNCFISWRSVDELNNKLPIGGLYFTVLPIWK